MRIKPHNLHSVHRLAAAAALLASICAAQLAFAQPPADAPLPLYQQEPYDQLTLDEVNGGGIYKIRPTAFPDRRVPEKPNPDSRLQVEVLHAGKFEKAQVPWRSIIKVQLFEQLVLAEAEALVAQQKFEEAYDYFTFLHESYPKLPGLPEATQNFLYRNAGRLFQQKKYVEALALLDELHRQNPQHAGGAAAIAAVTEQLLRGYVEKGQFAAARKLLERTAQRGAALATVQNWEEKLKAAAEAQLQTARKHMAAAQFRQARDAAQRALEIWPAAAGGPELLDEVLRRYPLVRVGVGLTRPWGAGPIELDRAARRGAPLVGRQLISLAGYGPGGAQYGSSLGQAVVADDRRSLSLRLHPGAARAAAEGSPALTGYDVSRWLVSLSDPARPEFRADCGSLIKTIAVEQVYDVQIELRRPHLSPLALLASAAVSAAPRENSAATVWAGDFARQTPSAVEAGFVRSSGPPQGVREILELQISDPREALRQLRRGRIDVLERVPPEALQALAGETGIRAAPYALPSIHVLVPNHRQRLAANATFRRALAYAIPRDEILREELSGGAEVAGSRVISGPFPAGQRADDPWGYAYDSDIAPLPYEPRLAVTLRGVAQQELASSQPGAPADGAPQGQSPPAEELLIGHGPDWLHRRACEAIARQLARCGFAARNVELAASDAEHADECHFFYVELTVTEPAIDVPRMFSTRGLAPPGDFLALAIRDLQAATNWQQARDELHKIHAIIHAELPLIPLWQLADHYAHRAAVTGIAARPISLYDGIHNWRISPQSVARGAAGAAPSAAP